MNEPTDSQLLRDYAGNHSEAAFSELVRRHLDFVYSAALRMVCDLHLAEDVTQGVFMALAKSAAPLSERPVLSSWLHRTAQNIAAQTVRTIERRRAREQEAAIMNQLLATEPDAPWEHIAPYLDAALGELSEPDRDAVLLRYFERKSAREMAQILGTSEVAAQKRVSRAVECLRGFFAKRGITTSAATLSVVLSANAVQAAPVGLAVTISTAAALGGTTIAATLTTTAAKAIAMTTVQKAIVTATVAVLAGAGVYEARQASKLREQNQALQQQQAPLAEENRQLNQAFSEATNEVAVLRVDNERLNRNTAELVSLRGELVRLKQENADLKRHLPALPSFAPGNTNGVAEGDYTSQDISTPKNAVAYSPGQAAGTPDTRPGNLTTAWTPREANAGPEWLQLEYAKAVDIHALKVYEEANSGAITKVTAVLPDGTETILDHTHQYPRTKTGVFNFFFNASVATAACVRIYFDTTLAPGRIGVDTVELRGRDDSKQWPVRVQASSYYDSGTLPRSP